MDSMGLSITQILANFLLQKGAPSLKDCFARLAVLHSWQEAPNSKLICEYCAFVKQVVEVLMQGCKGSLGTV